MSMYELSDVRIHERNLDRLLHGRNGEVGLHLRSLAIKIQNYARRLTGNVTGTLARSITVSQSRTATSQSVRVFSNVRYAYYVHEGTRPHVIDPLGGRVMQFSVRGRRVYAERVVHPGTRGKRYLTIPLRQMIR